MGIDLQKQCTCCNISSIGKVGEYEYPSRVNKPIKEYDENSVSNYKNSHRKYIPNEAVNTKGNNNSKKKIYFLNGKNNDTIDNDHGVGSVNSNEKFKVSKNKPTNNPNFYNFDINDKKAISSIKKIQGHLRGQQLRNKLNYYGVLKSHLDNNGKNEIKKYEADDLDVKFKEKLDTAKGWKKYYSEKEYLELLKAISNGSCKNLSNIDKKNLIYTNGFLLKNDKNSEPIGFYKGYLNSEYEYHGEGKLILKDGREYEGVFINGSLNGWGRHKDKSGNCYEGMFINDILNGKGIKIIKDDKNYEHTYEGEFKNFLKEGKGKEVTDECIYEGGFHENLKEGHGILTYRDNSDKYEGNFSNDTINGYGFYIWKNKHEYRGEFKDAKMHGKGEYKWPDGTMYYGQYIDGIKHGIGKFIWSEDKIYEGEFYDGKPHGKGILTIKGISINATFIEGKLSESSKELLKLKKEELKAKDNY